MGTRIVLAAALLLGLAALPGCSNPEQAEASRKAAQAAAEAKDDASCRESSGAAPGTKPYDECRGRLAQAHADEAIAQERRRLDFQHTLSVGTTDSSGH
jgi:hypothetical protein